MKYLLTIAVVAAAFTQPHMSVAQENVRFPEIRPEQFSPAQKQFADAISKSPRNGNVNNPPYKVYVRSPEFGRHAVGMSDYLRWGTSLEPRLVELAILIASRQWSSPYIWRAHYPLALK